MPNSEIKCLFAREMKLVKYKCRIPSEILPFGGPVNQLFEWFPFFIKSEANTYLLTEICLEMGVSLSCVLPQGTSDLHLTPWARCIHSSSTRIS